MKWYKSLNVFWRSRAMSGVFEDKVTASYIPGGALGKPKRNVFKNILQMDLVMNNQNKTKYGLLCMMSYLNIYWDKDIIM